MWMWFVAFVACTGSTLDASDAVGSTCDTAASTLPPACACDAPAVTIGTGSDSYVPVTDGDSVIMTHGPQGGWHVLGSARMAYLAPIVTIHYTITVVSLAALVSDNTYRVQMVQDSECAGYYPGMYGYLNVTALASGDQDTPPELLAGQDLLLRMEVTDSDARAAVDELHITAALDPIDEPSDTAAP